MISRWHRSDRGDSPIQFAVLAMPLMLLTFLVVQAGLVLYARSVALGAATQASSTARGYQSSSAAGQAKAFSFVDRAGGGLLRDTTAEITTVGADVTVTVRATVPSLIPGLRFPITQSATGPIERFVP